MKAIKSTSFQKVMQFAKPYRTRFIWVILSSVFLSLFAAARPYLLKQTVDAYLFPKDESGYVVLYHLNGHVLVFEVASQFYLCIGPTGLVRI